MEILAWNAGRRAAAAYRWFPGVRGTATKESAQCWVKTSPPTAQESAKSTNSGKTKHVWMSIVSDARLATVSDARLATVGSVYGSDTGELRQQEEIGGMR